MTLLPLRRPVAAATVLLALFALLSALVLSGPATAGPAQATVAQREPVARSLSLAVSKKTVVKGRKVKLTGSVMATDATCVAGQVLEVQRSTRGASYPAVGTVTTDAAGSFTFSIKVTKKARFRVSAVASATCAAALSPPRTVDVSQPAG